LITRRGVLARIGCAALGPALVPGSLSAERVEGMEPSAERVQKPGDPATTRRNILWIATEGVPLSVLSCYGSKLIRTPNIDRIANEGMRFENSFTTNALCAPSRATLTGKYSHLNGMLTNPGETTEGVTQSTFDPAQHTLPKILRQHGYQTGVVGKWHLPANPGEVEFDYFVFKQGAGGPYYEASGYLRNAELGSARLWRRAIPDTSQTTKWILSSRGSNSSRSHSS